MIKIMEYGQISRDEIFARQESAVDVSAIVADIIEKVRTGGDRVVLDYCKQFDKADLTALEVTAEEIDEAFGAVEPKFLDILRTAADNIRDFHKRQIRNGFIINDKDGIVTGQKVTPIEKVGLYVPGGTAAYPSTVLMDSIPAKLAGCREICIATPPGADGKINPVILAAAKIAGVDRIFKMGGAQAVAALAYGTESVPKVDKIVGPGNAFVAEAKRQVFGRVAIDMIAGPSEILVIADGNSNPAFVAADLLSQAEHDKMASAVLVTDSRKLADAVAQEIEVQLEQLPRRDIARASIDNNGKIIVADNLDEVFAVANEIAPEHLELCVDDPFAYLDKVENAGSVCTQDVVQVYGQNEGSANAPVNPRLVAFKRVSVPAGETVEVTIDVCAERMNVITETGDAVMEGKPVFYVGMGQPDARTEKLTGHAAIRVE